MRSLIVVVLASGLILGVANCTSSIKPSPATENVDAGAVIAETGNSALSAIPSPAAIKLGTTEEDDLRRDGSAFAPGSPNQHVNPDGALAVFSPECEPGTGSADGLAYAIYSFSPDGWDRDDTIHFKWRKTGDFDNAWVGKSNFLSNKWHWRPMPETCGVHSWFKTVFSYSLPPYSDHLLVAVVFMGTDEWALEEVYLGRQVPVTINAVSEISAPEGSTVRFWSDAAGEDPLEFEWYLGAGADSFPFWPRTTPEPSATLRYAGTYDAHLTVSNRHGAETYDFTYTVEPYIWSHTFGLDDRDEFTAVTADDADNIYAAGYHRKNTGEYEYETNLLLCKYSSEGQLAWAKQWRQGDRVLEPTDALWSADNALLIAGELVPDAEAPIRPMLMKWDAEGNLDSVQTWKCGQITRLNAIAQDSDSNIYLAGSTGEPDGTQCNALIIKLNPAREILWAKVYTLPSGETSTLTGIALSTSGDVYCSGTIFRDDGYDAAALCVAPTGEIHWAKAWTWEGWTEATSIALCKDNQPVVVGTAQMSPCYNPWTKPTSAMQPPRYMVLMRYSADGALLSSQISNDPEQFDYKIGFHIQSNATGQMLITYYDPYAAQATVLSPEFSTVWCGRWSGAGSCANVGTWLSDGNFVLAGYANERLGQWFAADYSWTSVDGDFLPSMVDTIDLNSIPFVSISFNSPTDSAGTEGAKGMNGFVVYKDLAAP